MWEKRNKWKLPTKAGELTYGQIITEPTLAFKPDTSVDQVTVLDHCAGCNLPGGGNHREGDDGEPLPEDSTKPCEQSNGEKGRCPMIRDVVIHVLHGIKECDTLACERCKRKGILGALRVGEIVMVSGVRTVEGSTPQGRTVAQLPMRRAGRFLGVDFGGTLRFEWIKPGQGPTSIRFWLTASGHFIDDPDDDDLEKLKTGKEPIILKAVPAQVPPPPGRRT